MCEGEPVGTSSTEYWEHEDKKKILFFFHDLVLRRRVGGEEKQPSEKESNGAAPGRLGGSWKGRWVLLTMWTCRRNRMMKLLWFW